MTTLVSFGSFFLSAHVNMSTEAKVVCVANVYVSFTMTI